MRKITAVLAGLLIGLFFGVGVKPELVLGPRDFISVPHELRVGGALAEATTNTGYPFVNGSLPPAALNAAFLAAYTCSIGPSAPTFGLSSATLQGACWLNTSVSGQITYEVSADGTGTHWEPLWTLNTSTFAYSSSVFLAVSQPLSVPLALSGGNLVFNYDSNFTVNGSNLFAFGNCASGQLHANNTSGSAEPTCGTLTALLDRVFGSTQGGIIYRGSSTWGALGPSTANYALVSGGPSAAPAFENLTTQIDALIGSTQGQSLYRGASVWTAGPAPVRSYLSGLVTAVASNTQININAGVAVDATGVQMITLGSFQKATAGAWVAGTAANGMGNGLTIANTTWYDVCLAYNGGTPDIWFDTSNRGSTYSECANKPTGISGSLYRRIGTFLTDGSAHIVAYLQRGDSFQWVSPVGDFGCVASVVGPALKTLTVPTGFSVTAVLSGLFEALSGSLSAHFYDPATNAPSVVAYYMFTAGGTWDTNGQYQINTNVSGQIDEVSTGTNGEFCMSTTGWIDRRGRDN